MTRPLNLPKGAWLIGVFIKNDQVACSVKDTGIAMSEDAYVHIFDRFNKIKTLTGRLNSGVGLGLVISKNLVELFG